MLWSTVGVWVYEKFSTTDSVVSFIKLSIFERCLLRDWLIPPDTILDDTDESREDCFIVELADFDEIN